MTIVSPGRDLNPQEIEVLHALAAGDGCHWRSEGEIAEAVGIHVLAVRSTIRYLIHRGLATRNSPTSKASYTATTLAETELKKAGRGG